MARLLASYMVEPATQTPTGLMNLSDYDQIFAITHAPTIYFYENPGEFSSAVSTLKDSLSKILVPFYPLAGRLRCIGSGGRLELDCNSLGAQLLVAESEAKIEDFGDFTPTPQIRSLIPTIDYNERIEQLPLLLVQVTKLGCGGASLGLGISHIMVDGASAVHFVTEWAKIARGEQSNNPPFLDRTVLKHKEPLPSSPRFDHTEFSRRPLLVGSSNNLEERKKETTVTMLKLEREEIEKLKRRANEGQTGNNLGQPYTVDFRNRIDPPLPKGYFGNAIFRATATTTAGELLSKPLHYASSNIREAINKATNEYLQSSLVFLKSLDDVSKYRNFHTLGCSRGDFRGNPNMEITSWTALPMYGADFGFGKEIYMGPGAVGFDGKSFILPSRDEDGSFTIALRLQVIHMEAFKKFFYEEI
ncbi:hypothetical protein LguiB_010549 [Lonicera macranthoides]